VHVVIELTQISFQFRNLNSDGDSQKWHFIFCLANRMLIPVRVENDVLVFRLQDVDLYGLPHLFGYNNYIVTSTYEDECPMVLVRSEYD
jgi:hypothetical protein